MQAAARIGQKRHCENAKTRSQDLQRIGNPKTKQKSVLSKRNAGVQNRPLMSFIPSYHVVWLEEQRQILRKRKSQVASADGVGEVRLHVWAPTS
jgi:hypothetical protein